MAHKKELLSKEPSLQMNVKLTRLLLIEVMKKFGNGEKLDKIAFLLV